MTQQRKVEVLGQGPRRELTKEDFTVYEHHDNLVAARTDLLGKHREFCLCYAPCLYFDPEDRENNCPKARAVFANCKEFGLVTPVLECPDFVFFEGEPLPPARRDTENPASVNGVP